MKKTKQVRLGRSWQWTLGLIIIIAGIALNGCDSQVFGAIRADIQAALDAQANLLPSINIKQGTTGIAPGDTYDFGSVLVGFPREVSFTVENRGEAALQLTGVSEVALSGDSQFSVVTAPSSSIPAGGSSVLTVGLAPASVGQSYSATLTIESNDSATPSFTFTVTGVGGSNQSPGGTVTIGSGNPDFINNDRQTLYFTVTDDASDPADIEMMVSNASDFSGAGWQSYASALTDWALANGAADGSKTVYVKFRDQELNESVSFSDIAFLDTTAPSGSVTMGNANPGYVSTTSITLYMGWNDGGGSGVTQMRVSDRADFLGSSWEPYQSTKSWSVSSAFGEKSVYARFADDMGNISLDLSDSVRYDDKYESTFGNNWWEEPYLLWTTSYGAVGSSDPYGQDGLTGQAYNGYATIPDYPGEATPGLTTSLSNHQNDWYTIYTTDWDVPGVTVTRTSGTGYVYAVVYRVDGSDQLNAVVSDTTFGQTSAYLSWDAWGDWDTYGSDPNWFLDAGYYHIRVYSNGNVTYDITWEYAGM